MFTDSHAHLTASSVLPELPGMLTRAQEKGVQTIINICTDKSSMEEGLDLVKSHPWIYNVGATTPHDVQEDGERFFPFFEKMARMGHLVAVGETGLDYYYEHSPKKLQQTFLSRYFALAKECHLPVVIHCRDAFEDLFKIANSAFSKGEILLHCFTGTTQEAEKALDKGWFISISGIVTFKRSDALRETLKEIPLDRLLIETDTPYLAPQSMRGKMNEPSFIIETAQVIADVKKVSLEELGIATAANAKSFFNLSLS